MIIGKYRNTLVAQSLVFQCLITTS